MAIACQEIGFLLRVVTARLLALTQPVDRVDGLSRRIALMREMRKGGRSRDAKFNRTEEP
jgi:hypothetical protein